MTGPRRLNAILDQWRPHDGGWGIDASSVVSTAWPDVVGADVARRTRPGKLRDGVLTVYTAGSAWSHQLTFLAPTIVSALNAQCPAAAVQRLRFVVASGRTKALLDGSVVPGAAARSSIALRRDRYKAAPAEGVDDEPENVEDIIGRLRKRQQTLDRRRECEGWTRCGRCGAWRDPSSIGDACRICAEDAQRVADSRIERVLSGAPWLRRADVAQHVADIDAGAFERVRARLLSRWEEQIFTMRRRLRRRELHATDRVAAWSYLMLRTGMQQQVIGRAVIADALGDDWADALAGDAAARHREAPASASQKQRNTTARVFTRRDNT
jgi:hypothetical protein